MVIKQHIFKLWPLLLLGLSLVSIAHAETALWQAIVEDDSFSGADQEYTSGAQVNYRSRNCAFWFGQQMYTPTQIDVTPTDHSRPYAGILYFGGMYSFLSDTLDVGFTLERQGGTSGAGWIQTHWHKLIHIQPPTGWNAQVPNKFNEEINVDYTAYKVKYVKLYSLMELGTRTTTWSPEIELSTDASASKTVGVQEERAQVWNGITTNSSYYVRVGERCVLTDKWLETVDGGYTRYEPYIDLGLDKWLHHKWLVSLGYRWNFYTYPEQKRMNTIGRICLSQVW